MDGEIFSGIGDVVEYLPYLIKVHEDILMGQLAYQGQGMLVRIQKVLTRTANHKQTIMQVSVSPLSEEVQPEVVEYVANTFQMLLQRFWSQIIIDIVNASNFIF